MNIRGSGVRLFGGQIGTGDVTAYMALQTVELTVIFLVAAADATVSMFHVPDGATKGPEHEWYRVQISANGTAILPFPAEGNGPTYQKGDTLVVSHDAAANQVTATVYGITAALGN